MTILIGARCKEGVIIGTDSAATFAHGVTPTIEQETRKISIIEDQVIVACTGPVGLGQRIIANINEAWKQKVFSNDPVIIGKSISKACIHDFSSTYCKFEGQIGALVAFPSNHDFHLCEFAALDFQPELKKDELWWVSTGSGQQIVDSFMAFLKSTFWKDGEISNHQDVCLAVYWALKHVININPGGIQGPIQIAVLEKVEKGKTKARFLAEEELIGHEENMDGAIDCLRAYADKVSGKDTENAPDLPEVELP